MIQTEKEIAPWKKTNPICTQDLNSYIAVKLVTRVMGLSASHRQTVGLRNQIQTQTLIQLWASSETKISKMKNIIDTGVQTKQEQLLAEVDISDRADFMDGYTQSVVVEYNSQQEEICVFLVDHNPARMPEPLLRHYVKLSDFLCLDNGSAYLGFCQETANLANFCLIENWAFESQIKAS